jgi:hypothetical protein
MSLKALAVGGHVSLIGASLSSSGTGLDPLLLTGRGITLGSISVGSRADFEAMNRAIALHRLRPVIDQTFPFAEAKAAYRHFEGPRPFRQGRYRARLSSGRRRARPTIARGLGCHWCARYGLVSSRLWASGALGRSSKRPDWQPSGRRYRPTHRWAVLSQPRAAPSGFRRPNSRGTNAWIATEQADARLLDSSHQKPPIEKAISFLTACFRKQNTSVAGSEVRRE